MEDSRASIARDKALDNRCKTCKYWDKTEKISKYGNKYSLRYCLLSQDYPAYKLLNEAFGVINGEPFNEGQFATGPEFGCIHHTT